MNNIKDIINVKNLNQIINNSLPDKYFKVECEVSKPKITNGTMYLLLKDDSACINAIIWNSVLTAFNDEILDGDKLTVSGKLDYYGKSGRLSFKINKIIKKEGLGELYKKYEKIKLDFEKKGYFLSVNKTKVSHIIKNILLVTSESGAAIQDFLFTLKNNNSKVNCDILDTKVQGTNCPNDICMKLLKKDKNNELNNYDLIVITRGGGSFEDLFGFSQPQLIEVIFNLKSCCVLSAIGHQVDTSLLDLVADYTTPTPSLAAQFIIDHNTKYLNDINKKKDIYKQILIDEQLNKLTYINDLKKQLLLSKKNINRELVSIKEKHYCILNKKIQEKVSCLEKININFNNISLILKRYLLYQEEKLKIILNKHLMTLNNKLEMLDKNEPISLYCNNKKINSPEDLVSCNGNVNILWNNYNFTIKIIDSNISIN